MQINQDILDRIKQINWFSNCGQALQTEIQMEYKGVSSWADAKQDYQSTAWENTTLEARNELTSFLHRKYRDQYSKWNLLAQEAKGFLDTEVMPKIELYREENKLDEEFIANVSWDIVNVIMESTYGICSNRPVFFLELLKVYEAGNFPCGWDGEWPNGKLIVY